MMNRKLSALVAQLMKCKEVEYSLAWNAQAAVIPGQLWRSRLLQ